MKRLFTFDSTHHALYAEQLAHDEGLAAEPVPAPPDAGVEFRVWDGPARG
ncbi:MAG TPA: putative Se/S carrier-like protein [Longimicrobiales bacterium]|nr:putative Se/S carrier-like protein [Longimicrobiales bacterium]